MPLAALLATYPATAVEVDGSLEAGFDSFVQQFRITDVLTSDALVSERALRDTTDTFTELRTVGQLVAQFGGDGLRTRLRPRISLGTDLSRESLEAELRWRPLTRSQRLDVSLTAEARQFREESDFSLSSDTAQLWSRIHWRRQVGEETEVGVRARAEAIDYEQRSLYEYDQRRGDVALTVGHQGGWTFTLDTEVGGGQRDVPDSHQIDYQRGFALTSMRWSIDESWRADVHASTERRSFRDETVRSPYWNFVLEPGVAWELSPGWRLETRAAMEWIRYDESTDVYFDFWAGRVGLLTARRFGSLEIGVEPRWSWLVSTEPVEDQYEQPSVLLKFDWYRQGRFWLSCSEEVGRRDYVEPLPDGLALYSDYTFFRTSFLGSYTLMENVSLDAFLSDEPESHRRSEDDGRLTLVTLSLRWSF